MRAPASAAARAPSKSTVQCPSATTTPALASSARRREARDRLRARASRAGRGRRTRSHSARSNVEIDRPQQLAAGARRARRRGTGPSRCTPSTDVGPRARAPRASRSSIAAYASSGALQIVEQARRCSRRRRSASTARDDLVDRTRSRSRRRRCRSPGCRRSPGASSASPRSTAPAGGGAGAGRDDAAVGDRRPRPGSADVPPSPLRMRAATERRSPVAVPPQRDAQLAPSRAAYAAPLRDRTCCGRAAARAPRPGSPRCAGRRARRAGSARCRRGPGPNVQIRGERLDRGAAHRLDAVRVGDVQPEHRRAASC